MNTLSYHLRHVNWIICVFVISAIFLFYNLSAQDLATPPYGLSNPAWQKLQKSQTMNVKNTSYFLTADEIVLNGSFETGDFSDWIIQDLDVPFFPLQVGGMGITPWSEFFVSEPTNGEYAALHGFDGAGPGYITLAQDVILDSLAAFLHFDYRAAWDLVSYGATQPRSFVINLEPSGGGEIFQSDTILIADPFEQGLIEDTGHQHGIVLLNSLPDTSVRITFEWYIPENYTGPAFFQLDNVFVREVSEGPGIYAFPDLLNFGNIVVNDTSDVRQITIYNIGTDDLTINDVSVSDPDFHLINLPDLPLTIPTGESEIVEIFFLPTDSGLVNATLTITSDDVDNPSVDISLSGRGIQVMPADPGICYASTGNIDGGRLLTIAPSTGAGTLIGDIGQEAVPAIAINSSGQIFGLDGNSGDIYLIDAATGTSFLSTNTGIEGLVAIAFDTSDVLYGYSSWTSESYTIDLQTGLSTIIGYTGANLRGLAFHPLTNTLFGSGHYELYTINITDGTTSFIGNTQLDMPLTDLSFDISGNLFASEGGANEDNYLVSINQSTAEGTRIGEIGFQSVSGLTFYNIPLEGRHISISPETINFGIIEVKDTTAVNVVSISNVGTEVLTVTDISTADTNVILSDLPVLPIVLPSRASQTFEVSISVSDTGVFNKTISISSDDPDKPVTDVQLNGRAIIIQSADNGLCYASTGNIDGGRLMQINPSNGTGTLIGETGLEAVPAVAINSEGKIYGLDENSGDIYRIDAATGFALNAIQTDIDGLVAIAFDINDVLYGYSSWTSNLYTIDLQTGLFTLTGYTGTNFRGLAFHPLTNMLYGSGHYELYTINVTDGTTSFIGNTQLDMPITDLSFNIAGNLFATEGGANEENYLVSINQSNAEGTRIGEIGFQSVSGLAFYNIPLEGRHISVSSETIDFGTFEVGDTSAVKLVSLSNIGTEVLTITDISGSDTTVILNDLPVLPIVLPSRASQTFEVSISVTNTGTFNKTLSITSDDPDNATLDIPLSGRSIVLHPAENGVCYASTGHEDGANLIRIAPSTGSGTLIGNTGLDAAPAIAINSDGWIYSLNARSGDIYKIDAETGSALDAVHTDIDGLFAIAFDNSDVLYGYSSYYYNLYRIDLETGLSTLIGYTGYSLRGLTFHPLNNTLWGSDWWEIYSINTIDGSASLIGNTNLSYPLTDLAFDISGNLYATSGGAIYEENQFVSIDTETGAGTIIGEIGFRSVSGLAFYTTPLEGRHISVLPDTLDLGTIEVGDTSYVKTISIANIGTDVLTVTDITVTDTTVILANLPDLPLVLASRASHIIDVSIFTADTGTFNKNVSIISDDVDNPIEIVTLTGRAVNIALADSGVWYASTGHTDGGRFISIDPATGAGTLIGSTGLDAVPAIAINSKGKIFSVDDGSGWLYRIDGQTGNAIEILNTHVSHITGLAFDRNDLLYAYSEGSNSLFFIDLERGITNLVGYTGSGFRGIAFNPIDNSLWGCRWSDIFTINTNNGVSTLIGNTFLEVPLTDIHFDILGNLYATAGGNFSVNNLAFIDKMTGVGSLIGEIGFETVSGLAFYNVPLDGRHLSVSPHSLDFGEVVVGDTSLVKIVMFGNIGTDDLTIEDITVSDTTIILSEIPQFPLVLSSLDFFSIDVSIAPVDTGSYDELVTLTTNDPEHLTFDIPIQAEAFSISPADSGGLYATTGHRDGGRLLKIDPATGQGTLIGETGLFAVPGLAINSRGEIYGLDASEGNLYRIDAQSGRAILVGLTNVSRMIAIAFDKDDNLYGYSDNFGSLYEINPQTGNSEHVVEIGYGFRGLAFNPVNNSLLASRDYLLYTININDGSTQIYTHLGIWAPIPAINFDMFGNLYGSVFIEWDSSHLFLSNPNTKQIGIVGDIGFEAVSGLAFYNVPKPGSHLQIYQKSVDFGLTAVGDTAISRTIDVYNFGTENLVIDEISIEETSFILSDISSLPWTLSTGESRTFGIAYAPVSMGSDTSTIEIFSNDSEDPVHYIGLSGEGSVFSLDGSFTEPEYVLISSKLNNNNSFGSDVDITNIYYTSDENYFILGIECSIQNVPHQQNFKPDGLGVFLNFSSESGMSAGEPLGYLEEYDFHFLNGASDLWGLMPEDGINFMADFEVDYMFAIYSDGTPNTIIVDASTFIWDNPFLIQHIGSTNQSGVSGFGPSSDGVFSERSLQFAFQSSTGAESRKGIEIRIPLSEINASPSDVFQVFATMVSSTAYFSDVSIPGNITPGNIGFNPNYNTNQRHDDCGCPNPGATIGTRPYHTDWNTITGIGEQALSIPTDYALSQNYPNPFNPLTTIEYQLPEAAEVELVIFNILGQKINTLLKGKKQAGYHSQIWNARDEFRKPVASGLYIYRLDAKGISGRKFVQVKKMVVLK